MTLNAVIRWKANHILSFHIDKREQTYIPRNHLRDIIHLINVIQSKFSTLLHALLSAYQSVLPT